MFWLNGQWTEALWKRKEKYTHIKFRQERVVNANMLFLNFSNSLKGPVQFCCLVPITLAGTEQCQMGQGKTVYNIFEKIVQIWFYWKVADLVSRCLISKIHSKPMPIRAKADRLPEPFLKIERVSIFVRCHFLGR